MIITIGPFIYPNGMVIVDPHQAVAREGVQCANSKLQWIERMMAIFWRMGVYVRKAIGYILEIYPYIMVYIKIYYTPMGIY